MHNVIPNLPEEIKSKIIGGVLFGDTRKKIEPQIPKYPAERVQIFCEPGDVVCEGQLYVGKQHFKYKANGYPEKAVEFLKSRIEATGSPKTSPVSGPKVTRRSALRFQY
jgi:cutinase